MNKSPLNRASLEKGLLELITFPKVAEDLASDFLSFVFDFKKNAQSEDFIGIFPHVRADMDAYGSSFALALFLKEIGVNAKVILSEAIDPNSIIFPLQEDALIYADDKSFEQAFQFLKDHCKACFMLDASNLSRLGRRKALWLATQKYFLMDHHHTDMVLDFPNWQDPNQPATCSMMTAFIAYMESPLNLNQQIITDQIADLLLAGILTDTGRLSYSAVSTETYLITAFLKSRGANQEFLSEHLFDEISVGSFRLQGYLASHASLLAGGRILFATLSKEKIDELGLVDTDIDCIPSWLRTPRGVDLAILLRESEKGVFRGNVRSNEKASARALAESFDGGGHERAAGFTLRLSSFQEAQEKVLEKAHTVLYA